MGLFCGPGANPVWELAVGLFCGPDANPMWEGACPRWRWFSQYIYCLPRRYRGQAPSHRGLAVGLFCGPDANPMWELAVGLFCGSDANPMWEGACSRWRWFSQYIYCLQRRYRGQAPSHRGLAVGLFCGPDANPMWELAVGLFCGSDANPMWEGAGPRWRWFSQYIYCLTRRYRGQAPSHRGLAVGLFCGSGANPMNCTPNAHLRCVVSTQVTVFRALPQGANSSITF